MPKESGLGDNLYVGSADLSGDVGAVQTLRGGRALLPLTGIDKSAMERTVGLKSGEIGFSSFWDTAAGQAHAILSALPSGDVIVTYFHGSLLGNAAASLVAKQVNYDPDLGEDRSLVASIQALSQGVPLEWGKMLTTGKQTFAAAGSGTSIDYGSASSAFGADGFLHAFSIGSGTATVAIQDSADNVAFTNVTGLVFAVVSGATSARVATGVTATIRRYVRVNVTGTFTNLACAINFVRFESSQTV